ncbi:MAG: radical SAM protein, partial [Micromonosporaceae bacterium]|nr:radical SAM protein [Micromonosporaceae bacterium]
CCVEEITPDGRLIPFCAYNSVGYREQVREQMSGVRVADVVPNARPIQSLLAESPYGSKVARDDGHDAAERPIAPDGTNVGRRVR